MNFITFLSGLLTPVIAVIAVYIAWIQARIQKKKLKNELYDKRLKIYIATSKIFLTVFVKGYKLESDHIFEYLNGIVGYKFLFQKDVVNFLNQIYKHLSTIRIITATIEDKTKFPEGSPIRKDEEKKREEAYNWIMANQNNVDELFSKYLTLKTVF